MTVLGALLRGRVQDPSVPLSSTVLADWLGGARSKAGVAVTEARVLGLPAYYRALAVKAGTLAALPLHLYEVGTRTRVTARTVLDRPNPRQTPIEFRMTMFANAIAWGDMFARKLRDGSDVVRQVWPIHPSRVTVREVAPTDDNPEGKLFDVRDAITDQQTTYTSWDIFHMPYMSADGVQGVRPLQVFRQSMGIAIAGDDSAASFYGNGSRISGVLRTEAKLNETAAAQLKKAWREKVAGPDNAGEIAVLDSGASFQPIAIPPADAQLLESRQWSVSEIGRMVGLPPHLYGDVEKSTSWGTGIEQQALGWVKFDLNTWITALEQRTNAELLPGGLTAPRWYSKHALDALLRGDSKARAEFYRVLSMLGALSPNEIRGLEDWETVDGLDFLTIQKNMQVIGADGVGALDMESLSLVLQRLYQPVGAGLLSEDEARQLANRVGADLP